MIDQLLDTIKEEVDNYLKVKMKNNKEQYIKLVPVVDQDGKPAVVENSICMTLVKIEEERVNMSNSKYTEYNNGAVQYYNQPVKLNLYILFSTAASDGQEKNYKEVLKRLSHVIAFFQANDIFTPANTPRLDPELGKIAVEIINMTMEEQNNLWSMLGSLYRPSVLYRFRTVIVQDKQVAAVAAPSLEREIEVKYKQ
jgi:hypothetical protein